MLLFAAAGCELAKPVGPDRQFRCTESGTTHGSTITAPRTWSRAAGPHHVRGDIEIRSTLTIQAGTLVCASPDARLLVVADGRLLVRGTSEAPVVLTATDPAQPWGGLRHSEAQCGSTDAPVIDIVGARIEHAQYGVVNSWCNVAIDNVLFRQIRHAAVGTANALLKNSIVDSAALEGGAAVSVYGDRSIKGFLVFENTRIRNSGGVGLSAGGLVDLALLGGRIEGSAGTGLRMWHGVSIIDAPVLTDVRPVRIVGNGGFPAEIPLSAAAMLYAVQPQDSLLGNAADTLIVNGSGVGDFEIVIRPGLPWVLRASYVGPTIRLAPGALLTVGSSLNPLTAGSPLHFVGGLIAEGTQAEPAVIRSSGARIALVEAGSSRLSHTRLEHLHLTSGGTHAVQLMDIQAVDTEFTFSAPDPEIRRLTLVGSATRPFGFRLLAPGTVLDDIIIRGSSGSAPGILVEAPDTRIARCDIRGLATDAIRIAAEGRLHVSECNLVDNAGLGVNNTTAVPASAPDNWWGDATGPTGPEGDGVSANVNYVPFRTSPVIGITGGG